MSIKRIATMIQAARNETEEPMDNTQTGFWVELGFGHRQAAVLAVCAGDYANMGNAEVVETAMNDYPFLFGLSSDVSVHIVEDGEHK